MARVDEAHLKSARLENLEERNPKHAGRLHRNGTDRTRLKPVGQRVEILRKPLKLPDRVGIAFGSDGHVDAARTNVDARRIESNRRRAWVSRFWGGAFGRMGPPVKKTPASGPEGANCESSKRDREAGVWLPLARPILRRQINGAPF
jgi:hypothetical protein